MVIKCVVACYNAAGEPDFYFCKVACTQEEYDNGDHYGKAVAAALDAGYGEQFVVFDENDGPAWLFDHFVWDSATTLTQSKSHDTLRS